MERNVVPTKEEVTAFSTKVNNVVGALPYMILPLGEVPPLALSTVDGMQAVRYRGFEVVPTARGYVEDMLSVISKATQVEDTYPNLALASPIDLVRITPSGVFKYTFGAQELLGLPDITADSSISDETIKLYLTNPKEVKNDPSIHIEETEYSVRMVSLNDSVLQEAPPEIVAAASRLEILMRHVVQILRIT